MANVNWTIENSLGQEIGSYGVDEDQVLPVPQMTDESGASEQGDLVVGDFFFNGKLTVKITTDLDAE